MSAPRYAQEFLSCDCGHYPITRFMRVFDSRKMPQEDLACPKCGNHEDKTKRNDSAGDIKGTRGSFHWQKAYEANAEGRIVE